MGRTGTVNHTHQYFRREDRLWACSGIDGCTHYMPRNMAPAPMGRNSICWSCEKSFQLLPDNMKNDKPMCDSCTEKTDIIGRYLDEVMPKPKGVTSLGKSPLPSETNTHSTRPEHSTENQEEDEVEVYDPDSE